jgi:hypothetical protein
MKRAFALLLVSVTWVFAAAVPEDPFDPPALYLFWDRDPSTTMVIRWHRLKEAKTEAFFRGAGETEWRSKTGGSWPLPKSERIVHSVELEGLEPGGTYEFCFAPGHQTFRFRTMPNKLQGPVRFVSGGDVYHEKKWMDAMNALAGKMDASFVVFGGDLAYSCSGAVVPEKMERWEEYFASWKQHARTPDGRLVPMLVAIGNHEVPGSWHQPSENAKVYAALFLSPGATTYSLLDFGKYLTLFRLDSSHISPVAGAQTDWLEDALKQRRSVPNKIPVYHVPAFPSIREDTGGESGKITQSIRQSWVPLFEKYGVGIAFENHDHAFKRTFPLRAGKVDPTGVIYLGDGAWGVNLRKPDPKKPRWYLERTGSVRHFFLVTLYPEARHILAVNENGEFFDEVFQSTR